MRVKRYIVDSMPEAMEKIRVELGKDAIILSSKSIKTGGFLGLFGKQQIEVIAAVEEKSNSREKAETVSQQERPMAIVPGHSAAQAYLKTSAGASSSSIGTLEKPKMAEVQLQSQPAPASFQTEVSNISEGVFQTASAPTVSQQKGQLPPTQMRREKQPSHDHDVAQELREMRQMFSNLLLQKNEKHLLPHSLALVRDRLVEQEVGEELVSTIISELLQRLEQPAEMTAEQAMQAAGELISERLRKQSASPARIERTAKCAFFFGPTGVGKTTTIAKLAAECMLKEKRRVGFITSDTYRIAAVEQLKTYANILNVPLEVVFSPNEIELALERLKHCDLILVDTAGRNYRNDEYVTAIKELLDYSETSVHYLVLSLTSKYSDMKAIAANFCDVPDARAIFTKADETSAYGTILNIVDQYQLALSYITTGQNVPDDIVPATPERVTKMILGDDTYA